MLDMSHPHFWLLWGNLASWGLILAWAAYMSWKDLW